MRDQRDFAPRRHRLQLFGDDADQQVGADDAGIERIVRLGAVADNRVGIVDDLPGDIAVVIEPENDRHVGAQDFSAELDLLALDIVDLLGGAGAVQLQRQPVDLAGCGEALPDLVLEEFESFGSDTPTGHGPGADDGDRLDLEPRVGDGLIVPAGLADGTDLFDQLGALVDAEGAVVVHGGQHRIEVVGFLPDVNERDTQFGSPVDELQRLIAAALRAIVDLSAVCVESLGPCAARRFFSRARGGPFTRGEH